jgi:hypothetical protein
MQKYVMRRLLLVIPVLVLSSQFCRKFAFLRPNPKIGSQKINDLRD